MRRTVRLATLPLNGVKRDQILAVAHTYAQVKDRFLLALAPASMWRHLASKQRFRDWAKGEGLYPDGANVHLVDHAAFDAVETWVRHIESVIATSNLKARIWRRFTGAQRHYAYSLLTNYADIGAILQGEAPERAKIQVDDAERNVVCGFCRRHLRTGLQAAGNPRAHLERSISLDDTLYSTWVAQRPSGKPSRRQYVSIISNRPGQRIVLPLAGISEVSGNIRVVMDEGAQSASVHVSYEVHQMKEAKGPPQSIDWGVTEVAVDAAGVHHGQGYGKLLQKISDENTKKGRRRGKLWSITKLQAHRKRAKRITRHNLGTKKQAKRSKAGRAGLRSVTGAAVKEIVYGEGNRTRARGPVLQRHDQRPRLIVCEDLSHLRGKARSKKLSRLCSAWMRSELEGRMTVHAYRGRSPTKAVNAAYTSQTCPEPSCGYVSSTNRNGDRFHCRNPHWDCNLQGDADQVAAVNLLERVGDPRITIFTTHTEVKKILSERFQRRLESRTGGVSVPLGTASDGVRARIAEGEATAHGRTPSKPRRNLSDVGGASITGADSQGPVHTARTGETEAAGERKEKERLEMPRYSGAEGR